MENIEYIESKEIELQENANETAININSDTKDDNFVRTKKHWETIDQIIVSQDLNGADVYNKEDNSMSYAVSYSKEDNSILGWSVNIKRNGQQQPKVDFKLDKSYNIISFVLYKKVLLFCYCIKEKSTGFSYFSYYKYRKYLF